MATRRGDLKANVKVTFFGDAWECNNATIIVARIADFKGKNVSLLEHIEPLKIEFASLIFGS